MRKLLVMLAVVSLVGTARADGPDEPKSGEQPAPQAAEQPAAQPATTPAPASVVAPVSAKKDDEEVIPNPSKKWGFAFGGAALGMLAIGAVTGGVATSFASAQNGNTSDPKIYTKDVQADGKTGANLATTAYIFIGLGAAAAVVDAVIWYECLRKPRTVPKKSARLQLTSQGVLF